MEGAKTFLLSNVNCRLSGLIGKKIRLGEDVQKHKYHPLADHWDHLGLEISVTLGKEDLEWMRG